MGTGLITGSCTKRIGNQTQVQLTAWSLLVKVEALGLRVEWSNTSGPRNEDPVGLSLSQLQQTSMSLTL